MVKEKKLKEQNRKDKIRQMDKEERKAERRNR